MEEKEKKRNASYNQRRKAASQVLKALRSPNLPKLNKTNLIEFSAKACAKEDSDYYTRMFPNLTEGLVYPANDDIILTVSCNKHTGLIKLKSKK